MDIKIFQPIQQLEPHIRFMSDESNMIETDTCLEIASKPLEHFQTILHTNEGFVSIDKDEKNIMIPLFRCF